MRQFSNPHLAALAAMVAGVLGAVVLARHPPTPTWNRWFGRVLAAAILAAWAGEYVADIVLHTWTVQFTLPLQLTDLVSLTAAYALVTQRLWAVELLYYWAFTATLQAVLTPDLAHNFPSVFYFTYFIYHVGVVIAAAFLVFGCRLYPRRGAPLRTFAATLVWAAVAGSADVITGGNYMYLAWKPAHSSLLSALGPWPWYIAGAAGVALVMLFVVSGLTQLVRRVVP